MSSSSFPSRDSWTGSEEEWQQFLSDAAELEWRLCSENPSRFIQSHLKTVDEVDEQNPDKPFPDVAYLRWLDDCLLTEPVLLIPKSRRVLVTWRVAAFCLWECLFRQARNIAYLNEDEAKAIKMVEMTKALHDSLPEWMKQRAPARFTTGLALFPKTRSRIQALEQGPDVGRMHAFSRIWIDEAQDQKFPADTYRSIQATTKGRTTTIGGKTVYTGTAKQGWWHLACQDMLTTPKPRPPAWTRQLVTDYQPPHERAHLPWGVLLTRQRESGYLVMQIHYTADPIKREPEWRHAMHKGVSEEDWSQEYEIDWKAKAGKPAIPQLRARWKEIVTPAFTPPPHWPRFATGDYGATNPTSWHFHAIGPDGRGYTYAEFYGVAALGTMAARLKAHPDFARIHIWILDGACWAATQQASETTLEGMSAHMVKSIAQLYAEQGIPCVPAARNLNDSVKIAAIERIWPKPIPDEPLGPVTWLVMDNCPVLLQECEGQVWEKLSYAQAQKRNDPERLVDKDNHAFDEFCYGLLHYATPAVLPVDTHVTDEAARNQFRAELQRENIVLMDEENEAAREMREDDPYDDGLD